METLVDPAVRAAVVRDLAGGEHRLEELWAERPAVMVFLRHFG